CLAGACTAPAVVDKPVTPADDAAADYQAALALNTLQAWDAFLKYHPDGFYADLAQAARKKSGFEAIAALGMKLAPLAAISPAATEVTECDRLGALVLDADKPAGVRGISRPGLVHDDTVAACRQAVTEHPEIRRFKTYLAFALQARDTQNPETL